MCLSCAPAFPTLLMHRGLPVEQPTEHACNKTHSHARCAGRKMSLPEKRTKLSDAGLKFTSGVCGRPGCTPGGLGRSRRGHKSRRQRRRRRRRRRPAICLCPTYCHLRSGHGQLTACPCVGPASTRRRRSRGRTRRTGTIGSTKSSSGNRNCKNNDKGRRICRCRLLLLPLMTP